MLIRLLVIAAFLAVVSGAYWWWKGRDGSVKALDATDVLTAKDLGHPRGYRATLVQFSTPMCAKCPGTARLLAQVASEHTHVVHVEVDASERLDLARRFDIMRTPTVLVLDTDGRVVARMNGAPTHMQATQALEAAPIVGTDYSI
jgi:thiol-disulfide isomerase/thioredoxin